MFERVCFRRDEYDLLYFNEPPSSSTSWLLNVGVYDGNTIAVQQRTKDDEPGPATARWLDQPTVGFGRSNTENYFHALLDDIVGLAHVAAAFGLDADGTDGGGSGGGKEVSDRPFQLVVMDKEPYRRDSRKFAYLFGNYSGATPLFLHELFNDGCAVDGGRCNFVCFRQLFLGPARQQLGGLGLSVTSFFFKSHLLSPSSHLIGIYSFLFDDDRIRRRRR